MIRSIAMFVFSVAVTPVAADELSIQVTGLRSRAGVVEICLWTEPAVGFPDCNAGAPVLRSRVPAAEATQVRLSGVPAGPIALSVLHDENDNGMLDTSLLSIPREGVAVSNKLRLGPRMPRFSDAAFEATDGAHVAVRLTYP